MAGFLVAVSKGIDTVFEAVENLLGDLIGARGPGIVGTAWR